MYKLIIFDLDGTLLDTLGDLSAAGNYALQTLGFPTHERSAYKHFVGNGIPKLVERMLPIGHSAQDEERALRIFSEYYSAHKTDLTVPYSGIRELVQELSQRKIVCACNTNKAHEFAAELIERFFGSDVTDLIGAGAGFPIKPSQLAAQELMKRHCADERGTLYVGDSNVDMITAQNAHIDACGVLWGFRGREELAAFNPKYLAENAKELRDFIIG